MREALNEKVPCLVLYIYPFPATSYLTFQAQISPHVIYCMNFFSVILVHMASYSLSFYCIYSQYHKASTTFLFKLALQIGYESFESNDHAFYFLVISTSV